MLLAVQLLWVPGTPRHAVGGGIENFQPAATPNKFENVSLPGRAKNFVRRSAGRIDQKK